MNDLWQEISYEYNQAKNALWHHEGAGTWRRDEDTGLYHLWNAYHKAQESTDKEELVYARILATMATEANIHKSEYEIYNKFVKPSLEAYQRAEEAGLEPSSKELDVITSMAESLAYILKCESAPYEEMLKRIEGHEKLGSFQFHDSRPLHFEHDKNTAKLTLKYDVIAEFRFDGVIDIKMHGDPAYDYVCDFYCYPCLHDNSLLTFDVDFYKILCSSISVESVSDCRETSNIKTRNGAETVSRFEVGAYLRP